MNFKPSPGCFITLEGIEGVGKTTQAQFVKDWLQTKQVEVLLTREPGGTLVAESIRSTLLHHWQEEMMPQTEVLLLFAARMQHLHHQIKPALQAGQWVVCDRFTDATYAYQGYGRGLSLEWIALIEKAVQQNFQPDLTLLLDAPVGISCSRVIARKRPIDRFESEQQAFFARVRQGYLQVAKHQVDRFAIIDASADLATVQLAIVKQLEALFAKHSNLRAAKDG